MLKTIFDHLVLTRKNVVKFMDQYSADQLNRIPDSFNNNLIWNAAHILVTQQLLCYRLCGLQGYVDDEIIEAYRKGSQPAGDVSEQFINQIKSQLISTADQMIEDYGKGMFKEYKTYTTSYGATLKTFEEAISFNNIHEGMHYGTMQALKKLV